MIEKFRIVVSRLFVIGLFAVVLTSSSATDQRWPLAGEALFLTGVFLAAIASMGRLWCSVYIAGYKTDVLVMQGPYSMTRNPLYFFSLIGGIGVALATETLILPLLVVLAFAVYYPFVIRSEEAVLLKRHGEKFKEYFKNVPRFIPDLTKFVEPDTYVVRPRIIKSHILDALWFIWLLGFLELIETLHVLDLLPTFMWVY